MGTELGTIPRQFDGLFEQVRGASLFGVALAEQSIDLGAQRAVSTGRRAVEPTRQRLRGPERPLPPGHRLAAAPAGPGKPETPLRPTPHPLQRSHALRSQYA